MQADEIKDATQYAEIQSKNFGKKISSEKTACTSYIVSISAVYSVCKVA